MHDRISIVYKFYTCHMRMYVLVLSRCNDASLFLFINVYNYVYYMNIHIIYGHILKYVCVCNFMLYA